VTREYAVLVLEGEGDIDSCARNVARTSVRGELLSMTVYPVGPGFPPYLPADFAQESELHPAFFVPPYRAHARYSTEGFGRLTSGGRLLLGFADVGSRDRHRHLLELR
jgi:hypothetical protein